MWSEPDHFFLVERLWTGVQPLCGLRAFSQTKGFAEWLRKILHKCYTEVTFLHNVNTLWGLFLYFYIFEDRLNAHAFIKIKKWYCIALFLTNWLFIQQRVVFVNICCSEIKNQPLFNQQACIICYSHMPCRKTVISCYSAVFSSTLNLTRFSFSKTKPSGGVRGNRVTGSCVADPWEW